MTNEELETRIFAVEAAARELQSQFLELKESVDLALQTLLPKVDALLANRETNGSNKINLSALLTPALSVSAAKTLLDAAEEGDTKTLIGLLEANAEFLLRNKKGDTALHLAAKKGHKDAVMYLVGYKALVDARGQWRRTPLHYGVEGGHIGIIQKLINAGADMNAKDKDAQTPLMLAANLGNVNVIGCLMQNKIDLNVPDDKGNSAIVHAAKAEQWNAVKYLCERGASVDVYKGDGNCPLMLATQSVQHEAVRSILRYGNKPKEALIIKCLARCKNVSIVLTFVDEISNFPFETLGGKALVSAGKEGCLESIVALLDAGVHIDSRDKRIFTSLHWASVFGHSDCVEMLIKRGAFLDAVGENGRTPLHSAIEGNKEQCVRLLLEAGANATINYSNGKTPLDWAETDAIRQIFSEFAERYSIIFKLS